MDGTIDVSGAIAALPASYWIMLAIIFSGLGILYVLTGGAATLKGGKKIMKNGPLGNARFATEKELNSEYPTIEYKFSEWCDIGAEREKKMREFDEKAKQMQPKMHQKEEVLCLKQREKLYTQLSKGLPTEPGILLGDWHIKGKVVNVRGKNNAQKKQDERLAWPNYPWYIKMKSVKENDPVTGMRVKTHRPLPIREEIINKKTGLPEWINHPENWMGGKVMTRVCLDDIHALLDASSGGGKSAFWLYPQAIYSMCCGISFVITDTKGDNVQKLSHIAKECFGYNTLNLDLRNPTRSCRFNIMHMVNKYTDLYDACEDKASEKAIGYAAKREAYAKLVANTIVKGCQEYGVNAYFYDSAVGLVQSCILLISEYGNKGFDPKGNPNPAYDDRHIISVYKLIQDVSGKTKDGDEEKTGVSVMLDQLDPDDKIRFFAGPAAQNSGDSQASVVSTAMSKLLSFIDTEMEQILCGKSDIDAEEFCEKKTILFINMPEENNTRYFLVSLVVSELYNEMLTIASQNNNYIPTPKGFRGSKARIMFYLDEFGTLPKIDGFEMMMSAARSRGIFFVPIVQGLSQLKRNYGEQSSKIILDNCKLTFFTAISSTSEDAEYFEKKLGNQTIITNSVSNGGKAGGGGGTHSRSQQMTARPLRTADEIRNMKKGDFIILRTADAGNTGHPIECHFDIYMDWGITLDKGGVTQTRKLTIPRYASRKEILDHISESKGRSSNNSGIIAALDMAGAERRMIEMMEIRKKSEEEPLNTTDTDNPADPDAVVPAIHDYEKEEVFGEQYDESYWS